MGSRSFVLYFLATSIGTRRDRSHIARLKHRRGGFHPKTILVSSPRSLGFSVACIFQWALSAGSSASVERQPHSSGDHECDSSCAIYHHGIFDWGCLSAGGARLVNWNADVSFIKATEVSMLIWFILITGIVVGILPGLLKLDRMFSVTNIVFGLVGAFIGAFIGFGDAPLFLHHPYLNEISLIIGVSILFVSMKLFITRNRIAP